MLVFKKHLVNYLEISENHSKNPFNSKLGIHFFYPDKILQCYQFWIDNFEREALLSTFIVGQSNLDFIYIRTSNAVESCRRHTSMKTWDIYRVINANFTAIYVGLVLQICDFQWCFSWTIRSPKYMCKYLQNPKLIISSIGPKDQHYKTLFKNVYSVKA